MLGLSTASSERPVSDDDLDVAVVGQHRTAGDDEVGVLPGTVDRYSWQLLFQPALLGPRAFLRRSISAWSVLTQITAHCPNHLILDVGTSTGRYPASWLSEAATWHLVDPVPTHVEQLPRDKRWLSEWIGFTVDQLLSCRKLPGALATELACLLGRRRIQLVR